MTEEDILRRAKDYLEKLSKGVDPLTGAEVGENDIVRNVRISKCLSYVAGFIDDVLAGGGKPEKRIERRRHVSRPAFSIDPAALAGFEYSESPLKISEIAERINSLSDVEGARKLSATVITNWLLSHGFLEEAMLGERKYRRVTDEGREIGIFQEERDGQTGKYMATFYTKGAQSFIIDNLEAILS